MLDAVVCAVSVLLASAPATAARAADPVVERDAIVAGGASDFMTVRHLVLRGSQREIGAALARIARDRHGVGVPRARDPLRARARRIYFERTYPQMAERMRGVADAYGEDAADDRFDFSSLGYPVSKAGCSVVYYPPSHTACGKGVLSRNFDFSTGTIDGRAPAEGELPAVSRPYVIETHPDDGYASLYLCAYDLLSGTVDGINSEGLAVALLADGEIMRTRGVEIPQEANVGFGVTQVLRFVLETCKSVEEAKLALLTAKHRYGGIPCHYIVADRFGDSFVWEHSPGRNRELIFDGGGKPQITTNFMLGLHPDLRDLPEDVHPLGSFARYRCLSAEIDAGGGPLAMEQILAANARVAADPGRAPMRADGVGNRTLWHSVYVLEDRRLMVDFYLGEAAFEAGGQRRSGYIEFALVDEPRAPSPTRR